jgi:serpin B
MPQDADGGRILRSAGEARSNGIPPSLGGHRRRKRVRRGRAHPTKQGDIMSTRGLIRYFVLFIVALFTVTLAARPTPVPEATASISAANNQFALEVFRFIAASAEAKGKNVFLSPYSISTALAMTYTGSRGETQQQMAAVLHFSLSLEQLNAGFADLLARTSPQSKHYQLNVANALWGQQGYHFEPAFLDAVRKNYGGGLESVDFSNHRTQAIHTINAWVEKKTEQKIRNLLHDDDITELTRMVLTNAIYFKGDWAAKFSKDATGPAPFKLALGSTVQVPMMHQTASFLFSESMPDGLKAIELPYAGDDLAMVILLPEGGLEKLEGELTVARLKQLRASLHETKVEVSLPKFQFETRYQLADLLAAMGMPDAFSETRADFSGMTGTKALRISRVIHQAMIDVNEEGSEAAAATAVVMMPKSVMMRRPVFNADHPFLFFIIHKPTDSILFMGRYAAPPKA